MKKRIVLVLLVLSVMTGSVMTGLASAIDEIGTCEYPGHPPCTPEVWIPEPEIPEVWIPETFVCAGIGCVYPTPEVGTCEYPGHPPCTPPEDDYPIWITHQWFWWKW